MQDRARILALMKDDAIFSTSDSTRRKSIVNIVKLAKDPIPILDEIVESLPESDDFKRYCMIKIEEIRNERKS